ncbi:MAG: hypothetical protein PWQ82_1005 [Thermosediminibacterales bacterium]|nr:hypothetical protein [Thermosediminibacterales bacterium]MDK2836191.1 hypothetical protein [Thermosediminibacterales bacterium]
MNLSDFLVKKFIKSENLCESRKNVGCLEAWISIILNLIIASLKLLFGFILNSIALIADGVHTASDVTTSIIVLIGFKISALPPDEEHPHGHGRVENIAALIIAVLLIITGLQFAEKSVVRIYSNEVVNGNYYIVVILCITALIKEWLARFSVYLGKTIDSSTLIADAWHHRTDALATLLVALGMVLTMFGYNRVDAVMGIFVSILIIYTGFELGKESANELIGKKPDPQLLSEIGNTVAGVEGIEDYHKINVHNYGTSKVIDLHIQVEKDIGLEKAHEISHEVEKTLNEKFNARTIVHIEPLKR